MLQWPCRLFLAALKEKHNFFGGVFHNLLSWITHTRSDKKLTVQWLTGSNIMYAEGHRLGFVGVMLIYRPNWQSRYLDKLRVKRFSWIIYIVPTCWKKNSSKKQSLYFDQEQWTHPDLKQVLNCISGRPHHSLMDLRFLATCIT